MTQRTILYCKIERAAALEYITKNHPRKITKEEMDDWIDNVIITLARERSEIAQTAGLTITAKHNDATTYITFSVDPALSNVGRFHISSIERILVLCN